MVDTPQQAAVLRRSKTAQAVRRKFPEGTFVRPRQDLYGGLTASGVVERHIPMANSQGGVLVVTWNNGSTGRVSAGDLEIDQRKDSNE